MNISSDLEEAMTEVRQKLVLQQIKCSVLEKYFNLSIILIWNTSCIFIAFIRLTCFLCVGTHLLYNSRCAYFLFAYMLCCS